MGIISECLKVDFDSVAAEFIELNFRDQYIGRSDMWRLKLSLTGTPVYTGKKITFAGCIRAQVKQVVVNGKAVMIFSNFNQYLLLMYLL